MVTFTITIGCLLGTQPNHAVILVPRLLGSVSVMAGTAANRARVSIPRLLGRVDAHVTQVNRTSMVVGSLMGRCRIRARCLADEWSLNGFPPPVVSSYGYSKDAGLVRTEFRSGATRQRRRWGDGRRSVTATFNIQTEDLFALETFINTKGYTWFTMGLITSDNSSDHIRLHTVRIKGNPKAGNIYGDTFSMSLELELQG